MPMLQLFHAELQGSEDQLSGVEAKCTGKWLCNREGELRLAGSKAEEQWNNCLSPSSSLNKGHEEDAGAEELKRSWQKKYGMLVPW